MLTALTCFGFERNLPKCISLHRELEPDEEGCIILE